MVLVVQRGVLGRIGKEVRVGDLFCSTKWHWTGVRSNASSLRFERVREFWQGTGRRFCCLVLFLVGNTGCA